MRCPTAPTVSLLCRTRSMTRSTHEAWSAGPPGDPIRSICPESTRRGGSLSWKSANLRLEDPAFTDRTEVIEKHGTEQTDVQAAFHRCEKITLRTQETLPTSRPRAPQSTGFARFPETPGDPRHWHGRCDRWRQEGQQS